MATSVIVCNFWSRNVPRLKIASFDRRWCVDAFGHRICNQKSKFEKILKSRHVWRNPQIFSRFLGFLHGVNNREARGSFMKLKVVGISSGLKSQVAEVLAGRGEVVLGRRRPSPWCCRLWNFGCSPLGCLVWGSLFHFLVLWSWFFLSMAVWYLSAWFLPNSDSSETAGSGDLGFWGDFGVIFWLGLQKMYGSCRLLLLWLYLAVFHIWTSIADVSGWFRTFLKFGWFSRLFGSLSVILPCKSAVFEVGAGHDPCSSGPTSWWQW